MIKIKPYYQEKGIKIFNGDCLSVLEIVGNNTVDMVLADLPYGITANKWDSEIDLQRLWRLLERVSKEDSVFAFTASQPFTSTLVLSKPEWFKHEWIWRKDKGSNFANTVREPMKEHESVLIFSKNGIWTYNPIMQARNGSGADRVKYNFNWRSKSDNYRDFDSRENQKRPDERVPSSVQDFTVERGKHPTQKPITLAKYLIKTYTDEGDMVLDPTIGSGTTILAARDLGREAIGIEAEKKYCEVAKERLSQQSLMFTN